MGSVLSPAQVREQILSSVSANGGHLASSLGAVELACALAEVFDPKTDRVIWDIGHQAYAWKILTGRADRFGTLRRHGGIAPFLSPAESKADAFISGHAGVAIAAAAGIAAGDAISGTKRQVVAVVGDQALGNGESLEALRNIAAMGSKVMVVVNDNEPERGGCEPVGNVLFGAFGLACIGPVDGNDRSALVAALQEARQAPASVVVHVVTRKGEGFEPAMASPAVWHSVGPFELSEKDGVANAFGATASPTWSEEFGKAMVEAARRDGKVCAVVAAMKDGTGLAEFAEAFPERFFDVGICEEMAVTFAAGLAKSGMRPVVAIYSTFLQRAIDQIQHDVCLQGLPVVFAVDRAGCVGADGATHHGLYDIPLLRPLTGMRIVAPTCVEELKELLDEALAGTGPTAIRYPKGEAARKEQILTEQGKADVRILAVGNQVPKAIKVRELLADAGVRAALEPATRVKPFEGGNASAELTVSLEDGTVVGSFGESVGADMVFGWPDAVVGHGTVEELEREFGFDAESISCAIVGLVNGRKGGQHG